MGAKLIGPYSGFCSGERASQILWSTSDKIRAEAADGEYCKALPQDDRGR